MEKPKTSSTKTTATTKKVEVKTTVDKKRKKSQTHQGGKRNQIEVHPKIKRVTSYGQVVESRTAVIAFGRINPPSIGHERLVTEAAEIAESVSGHAMLFLSPTNNAKNPLTDSQKFDYVAEAFGDIIDVRSEKFSNPITLLQAISESYDKLIWVTGSDQAPDYTRIVETYNGADFTFEAVKVIGLARDGEQLNETISATQLRNAVSEGDMETFKAGLPTKLKTKADLIFEQVQQGMLINENKTNPLINLVREAFQSV